MTEMTSVGQDFLDQKPELDDDQEFEWESEGGSVARPPIKIEDSLIVQSPSCGINDIKN